MNNPLSNLKHAMDQTVLKEFSFSEERKNAVKDTLRGKSSKHLVRSWNVQTIILVLETLQNESKQGYDISTYLLQRQEHIFQNKEGELYTLLHVLEKKELVMSEWSDEKKYYRLSTNGKKMLASYQKGSVKQSLALKRLLEEATL